MPFPCYGRIEDHYRDGHTGVEAIDAVSDVNSIHCANNYEHTEDKIENPRDRHINVGKRDIQVSGQMACPPQQDQEQRRCHQLEYQLLNLR